MSLETVPEEVGLAIVAHLEPHDLLCRLAPVSRRFHRWVHDPALWRALLAQELWVPNNNAWGHLSSTPTSSTSVADACRPAPVGWLCLRSSMMAGQERQLPKTYEEWWKRWRALDRRATALNSVLHETATPKHRHFTVEARAYLLPPMIAPLDLLTSTTSTTGSTPPTSIHADLLPTAVLSATNTASSASITPDQGELPAARRVQSLEAVLEALGFAQPLMKRFRDAAAVEGWFGAQIFTRYRTDNIADLKSALCKLFPPGDTESAGMHTLYHVQKKHYTGTGIVILHHAINALVFIRISDFD